MAANGRMVNSPFKWVGGKSRLREAIIRLIPPDHTCYVELFAGAAWVLLGKPPSQVEILNDLDEELITFFRVVKDDELCEALVRSFEWDLISRAEFNRLAALDPRTLTPIERAHRFYYLIMAGWGGELAYPRFQTSITDGGYGNRLVGAIKTPEALRARLEPVRNRLRTVLIENLPWEACFERYDRAGVVMYLDPPYPDNKCNYAHNMRDWEDHRRLAEQLGAAACRWILSSYDTPEIRELYAPFDSYFRSVQSASGMNITKRGTGRVMNREVLITNFDPDQPPVTNIKGRRAAYQSTLLENDADSEL